MANKNEIDPLKLTLEQLNSLKTQHEEEINELNKQLEVLYNAKNRFINARNILDDISKYNDGDTLLVPLTSSLYVPGTILNPTKVMVELGTGYYCEKDIPSGKDLIDRKVTLVNTSIESIEGVGNQKQKNLETIGQIMQYKISMIQANK
eukprot:gene18319-24006_t